jgi:hypothetical protein
MDSGTFRLGDKTLIPDVSRITTETCGPGTYKWHSDGLVVYLPDNRAMRQLTWVLACKVQLLEEDK